MNTDKPLGAGLIAFAIAGIIVTMQISVRTFNDDPGPKLFPLFGFSILLLCGIGILMAGTKLSGDPSDQARPKVDASGARTRGAVMFGLLVAYSVALWLTGYYVATPLLVYAFYHTIAGPERRVWWRGAIYALVVTGGVHLIFAEVLNAFLPRGTLF